MSGDPDGTEYAAGGRGDEAMRSLAKWCGVPLPTVLEARGDMGRLGQVMIESRGSFACNGCGGGLMWRGQMCRCGSRPGDSHRIKGMPWETSEPLDGAVAQRMLERRFAVPL